VGEWVGGWVDASSCPLQHTATRTATQNGVRAPESHVRVVMGASVSPVPSSGKWSTGSVMCTLPSSPLSDFIDLFQAAQVCVHVCVCVCECLFV